MSTHSSNAASAMPSRPDSVNRPFHSARLLVNPHLLHIFPAFGTGGPEVRTAEIINHTQDRFRHTILSLDATTSGMQKIHRAGSVECRPPESRSLSTLRREILRLKPNLILTYGWGGTDAILAARLARTARVVHTEDGFLPDETNHQKLSRLWVRRCLIRLAAKLVVPSLTLKLIARKDWWLPDNRIGYIPNGVDMERFHPATEMERTSIRDELGLPNGRIVVGSVGALRPEKNFGRLLRVFSDATKSSQVDAHLLLVGDGPEREALQAEATRLAVRDRVTFCGHVVDPSRHYRAMDVFCVSSDTEQMPIALLESMATGCAVAGTDVGDVKPMVAEQNQPFIGPPNDESAFVRSLEGLLGDPSLRRELGHVNQQKCREGFSKSRMFQEYDQLYCGMLAS